MTLVTLINTTKDKFLKHVGRTSRSAAEYGSWIWTEMRSDLKSWVFIKAVSRAGGVKWGVVYLASCFLSSISWNSASEELTVRWIAIIQEEMPKSILKASNKYMSQSWVHGKRRTAESHLHKGDGSGKGRRWENCVRGVMHAIEGRGARTELIQWMHRAKRD